MTSIEPDPPIRVDVQLGDRSYDIHIGDALLARAGSFLEAVLRRPRTFIVSDEQVADLHLESLQAGLRERGIGSTATVLPPGEATKSFRYLEQVTGALLDHGAERGDVIVALGGGVIGDLTGFAAAILRRGVDFVQIPTTLLAQVDSSVGGKVAINMPQGKNLVGAFHQPRMVLCDSSVLETLPEREFRAGFAEIVKYGLLGDADFFDWLEQHGPDLVAGDAQARRTAIQRSCENKARIVVQDEREAGVRALLNLGHTFGHALEAETGFSSTLLHGEGVAIGIMIAFEFSHSLGLCPGQDVDRVRRLFTRTGLPKSVREIAGYGQSLAPFAPRSLLDHMYQDKKVSDGKLTFILVNGIGKAFVRKDVVPDSVVKFLERIV